MRRVLLFDVMDTLVYNPYNREIPEFFGLDAAELRAQSNPAAWIRFELGEIDEQEYLRSCFRDGRAFDQEAFLETVARAYRWIDGAPSFLKRLSEEGFEMHALSNYPLWYRTIEERLGLSRYLEWTFVSCHTRVRKPDAEAFVGAARQLGLGVESCLLIDDVAANCAAAERLGLSAILFQDTARLVDELQRRQLIC